jgi:hypothetical protein
MSFSGGGQSPLINHVHDNNPGSGGALSQTATLMGANVLYTLITDNTAQVNTNTTNIAALTANIGKWSATNTATFRNSVLVGIQSGTIEEVT